MNSKPENVIALVVDDQASLVLLIGKTLKQEGFTVLTASNGRDAMSLCRESKPRVDLMVTDYSMPGMTGVELAQACRRFNSDMGVLYISGSSPGDDLRSDLKPGRRTFLAKPFRQSELIRSAKALLGMESALAQNVGSSSD